MFRAQLILHDKVREVFEGSLRLAREKGYLKRGRGMRVSLDTTYILGRGAVKDTYNLLADGIVKLMRAMTAVEDVPVTQWAVSRGYKRYVGASVKGEAAIDCSDRQARRKLLAEIVADADRLLELARQAQGELPADSVQQQTIADGAELLGQLLLQDVRRLGDGDGDGGADGGVSLKDRVSKDRIVSVHDREMRHGHKSSRRRSDLQAGRLPLRRCGVWSLPIASSMHIRQIGSGPDRAVASTGSPAAEGPVVTAKPGL